MGCFLDCFRLNNNKTPAQQHDQLSYVPLDSHLDIKQNTTSDLKEKQKEAAMQKIKKKVRFDLNVKAYEPIPHNEDEDEDDDDDLGTYFSDGAKSEFNVETSKSMALSHYDEENVIASSLSSHRYQNCIDNYYDELMMLCNNDLNFNENEDDATSEEDFPWEFESDHYYNDNDDVTTTSRDLDRMLIGRKSSGRDRSKYVCSVLNPVENLSQWKAVKAKGGISAQCMCEKENFNY